MLMIFDANLRTKTTPKRPKHGPKELHFSSSIYASILDRFWLHVGSLLGAFLNPKIDLKSILIFSKNDLLQHKSQDHPKRPQDLSKRPPGRSKRPPGPSQEAPRGAQEAPQGIQKAPRCGSKRSPEHPQRPQDLGATEVPDSL